jgi:hypothetical protein
MSSSVKDAAWAPVRHEAIQSAPSMAGARAAWTGPYARRTGPETAGHQFAAGGKKVPWWAGQPTPPISLLPVHPLARGFSSRTRRGASGFFFFRKAGMNNGADERHR